jgi:hypothetical protein
MQLFYLRTLLICDIIVYCYTSCTRQSSVEREGLEHDERSEEHAIFSKYFSLINLIFLNIK